MFTSLLLFLTLSANAGELAGVTLPDQATVGDASLVLNGMGLREKYWIDIYVGALYLPERTTSADTAISSDVPKRIVMSFIYKRGVTKAQLAESFEEGFAKQPNYAAVKAELPKLIGFLEDVGPGDRIEIDYVPGKGTTLTIKGQVKGTVPGVEFMKAVYGVYLGAEPPTEAIKKGMLGG